MRFLSTIIGVVNPAIPVEDNARRIERQAWQLRPTQQGGVDTTLQSWPLTGTWDLGDRWTDALLGQWVCISAGTPGTWRQTAPAIVIADPTGTIPAGYRICLIIVTGTREKVRERVYDGTSWLEVGMWGAAMATQAGAIGDATGGTVIDVEARSAINALLAAARTAGLIAP